MTSVMHRLENSRWYDRIYKIGVGIKGFDGLVELVLGVLLLVSPDLLHRILAALIGEAHEYHGQIATLVANYIARTDGDLVSGSVIFLAVFLISHGVIKLALVYCLLREILWAYPYALAVLGMFLLYQLYAIIVHPTLGMGLLVVLDIFIIWLVWGEWQKLKREKMV